MGKRQPRLERKVLKVYYNPKNPGSYGGLQLAVKNNGGGRPLNIKKSI